MIPIAQTRSYVIGVDCHARTHTYAVINARTAEQIDCQQFPTTRAGLDRAIEWVGRRTHGDPTTLWVVEGTGSYGAQLFRAASNAGYDVVEAPRMTRETGTGLENLTLSMPER